MAPPTRRFFLASVASQSSLCLAGAGLLHHLQLFQKIEQEFPNFAARLPQLNGGRKVSDLGYAGERQVAVGQTKGRGLEGRLALDLSAVNSPCANRILIHE